MPLLLTSVLVLVSVLLLVLLSLLGNKLGTAVVESSDCETGAA